MKKNDGENILSWVKTVIILPFNVLVIMPAVALYFTRYIFVQPVVWRIVVSLALLLSGLILAGRTMFLFASVGGGTAAPWNPPKNLVVKGPYRYVRNPMITSVLTILISEAIFLSSLEIFCLFLVFFAGNIIYFPLFEEKDLIKRFGEDYILYKNNVPRWLPRVTPWDLPNKR